jgi:integrative and conjugative element protein (TIGR02256 family)
LISIPEPILAAIVLEANNRFPRETGGVLLGHWVEGRQAVVSHMIGPGPRAKHSYSTFEPDYQFQEAEIVKICGSVDAGCDYLGDWHSHPRGSPHPSARDVRVLQSIASYAAARCKDPVMCIVSGGPNWEASACQLVDGRCLEIELATTPVGGTNRRDERSSSRTLFHRLRNILRVPRT